MHHSNLCCEAANSRLRSPRSFGMGIIFAAYADATHRFTGSTNPACHSPATLALSLAITPWTQMSGSARLNASAPINAGAKHSCLRIYYYGADSILNTLSGIDNVGSPQRDPRYTRTSRRTMLEADGDYVAVHRRSRLNLSYEFRPSPPPPQGYDACAAPHRKSW